LLSVMNAQQQRAEARPRALRIGIAADDELLPHPALDLLPAATAHRLVCRRRALGDDAFEAHAAGLRKERRPVAFDVIAEANERRVADDLAQQRLAIRERR